MTDVKKHVEHDYHYSLIRCLSQAEYDIDYSQKRVYKMLRSDRVRALRLKMGLTHEELAEALQLGTRQVARYESGENDPSSEVISRMAKVFNVSSDYLLGLTDDPTINLKISDLTPEQNEALAAWRRGDKLEAIRIIANTNQARSGA